MRLRRIAIVVLLGQVASASAFAATAGCYKVEIANSSGTESAPPIELTDTAVTLNLPSGTYVGNKVLPAAEGTTFHFAAAVWSFEAGELVVTFTSTGSYGVEIRAHKIQGGFRGVIQNFWDAGPTNTRAITLTLVSCKSLGKPHNNSVKRTVSPLRGLPAAYLGRYVANCESVAIWLFQFAFCRGVAIGVRHAA